MEQKTKILIAEDTPIQGKKLKFYLEKFGYDVVWAKDGLEAWQVFQETSFSIIITDVQMPNMDGLEFLKNVKSSKQSHTPVIVLTTLKDDETLLKALDQGASEFLNKPFRPQELQIRVKNLVMLSKFHNLVLNENQHLSEELLEKNRILEENFKNLNKAHEDLKNMKAQLVQSSKNSAIGVMGAGIAHEINNPLAIIDGYNDRLGDLIEAKKLDVEHIEKINTRIKKSTERIKNIVLQIRDFAHGSGGKEAVAGTVDLKELLINLSNFFGDKTNSGDVKLSYELPDKNIQLKGIPSLIEHAMFNIVHNAIDAVQDSSNKSVVISVREVEGAVSVEVKDSGPGINEDDLCKIYDPFFTTKEVGQGVGLGLSVARSNLEELGASIDCHSDSKYGTIFRISFPKMEAA
ncbi:MAG: response regulator [Bdellovibrionales bacterium]